MLEKKTTYEIYKKLYDLMGTEKFQPLHKFEKAINESDKEWISKESLIKLIEYEMSFDKNARNDFNKGAFHSLEKLRKKVL